MGNGDKYSKLLNSNGILRDINRRGNIRVKERGIRVRIERKDYPSLMRCDGDGGGVKPRGNVAEWLRRSSVKRL